MAMPKHVGKDILSKTDTNHAWMIICFYFLDRYIDSKKSMYWTLEYLIMDVSEQAASSDALYYNRCINQNFGTNFDISFILNRFCKFLTILHDYYTIRYRQYLGR